MPDDAALSTEAPSPDGAKAIVARLIDRGLGEVLRDVDNQRRLAEGVCAVLPLPPPVVRATLKLLAPLVCAAGGAAGSYLGAKVQERVLVLLLAAPLAGRLLAWLDARLTGGDALDALIRRAAPGAADLPFTLPRDLRAAYAQLAGQAEIKARLEGLDAWLKRRLNPAPPLGNALWAQEQENRFHYRSLFVPFAGRDAEIAALSRFLDGGEPFRWALVHGAGGMGKSRLALEFCLRRAGAFESGFLARDARFEWETWDPDLPALVVIDYASGDPEGVRRVLRALQRRQGDFAVPVRVLLLDRDAGGAWFERLLGGSSEGGDLRAVRFADDALALEPLADPWPIIKFFFRQRRRDPPPREATLDLLRAIDPAMRPLFAAFLGDALADGRDARGWDREQLVGYVLAKERQRHWPPDPSDKETNLYVLATMTRGLDLEAALAANSPLLPDAGSLDAGRLARMAGRPVADALPPLEPDILGELFVLEHLRKNPLRIRPLRDLAWRLSPLGTAVFALNLTGDYPLDRFTEGDERADAAALYAKLLAPPAGDDAGARRFWAMQAVDQLTRPLSPLHRPLHADLRDLAAAHPKEPALRERQAEAAFNLVNHLGPTDPAGARALHDEVRGLAAAHPGEPALREAQAKAAVNLVAHL
ncbi:MAG: hypothetical protein KDG89_00965, partial [Geminicoccaceae bacterium]|nr:hypothetical protein [Geminicoccaceae bacterium]